MDELFDKQQLGPAVPKRRGAPQPAQRQLAVTAFLFGVGHLHVADLEGGEAFPRRRLGQVL